MTELLGHLRADAQLDDILKSCICIPCMMPFITSQFLCREKGDRPKVRPEGAKNFAFVGQFCELLDDVVFTVEYSVRSAQTAVYSLLVSSALYRRSSKAIMIPESSLRRSKLFTQYLVALLRPLRLTIPGLNKGVSGVFGE